MTPFQISSFQKFGRLLIAAAAIFLSSLPGAVRASDIDVSPEIVEARLKGDQFVVTSTKDSGAGSLRQAIADAANASSIGSVITFSSRLNGKTIVLSSGELLIEENSLGFDLQIRCYRIVARQFVVGLRHRVIDRV